MIPLEFGFGVSDTGLSIFWKTTPASVCVCLGPRVNMNVGLVTSSCLNIIALQCLSCVHKTLNIILPSFAQIWNRSDDNNVFFKSFYCGGK